ncbi:hypothetical protein CLDAP_21520 [Caldilinea aerophila DSM 14535 = NBRC 104270]|jgi:hypothetical protein|uniref:Uncharacterized protein n=1 Tax=Caldilinea aerophila (strain DSM 14535 / JCM 11387 / NBRC 104270 / STL-6-O1) TaxID=926550 RepID=I0I4K4_CALAS|nr:hypothetical protein CLDAP_21520 [Caldilinea aerophila DSM 14535 = NBRC 104270]
MKGQRFWEKTTPSTERSDAFESQKQTRQDTSALQTAAFILKNNEFQKKESDG